MAVLLVVSVESNSVVQGAKKKMNSRVGGKRLPDTNLNNRPFPTLQNHSDPFVFRQAPSHHERDCVTRHRVTPCEPCRKGVASLRVS
jgi:hypothetical protein